MRTVAAALLLLALPSAGSAQTIDRSDTIEPRPGPTENFTGEVSVKPLFPAGDHSGTSGGHVTFQAGARSAWHSHPAGQTLIVTSGTGWVQEEGGEKHEIRVGDVIRTKAGVKHWHGATDGSAMSHVAVTESVDGRNAVWMEHVTDEQYLD
ncbi:hypothetical protein GCM10011390_21490 [Aureimonas endophytica]|uniref:Cupin type-2 domain-containing protein n=1 Tax=Aureimonas endophytica TaxID=2027858 RepID=A0A917E3V4_9HYPH|nr:cupin domain-containing protein [Aureimonas endophytica]GGE02329.1 hypothetical protein GCM10011390_21490 [Aureimonas endophytica]